MERSAMEVSLLTMVHMIFMVVNVVDRCIKKVSLTNTFSTAQLDSGLLSVSISFWEKTSDAPLLDTGQVTLIFLSATNISLFSATTGPKACISAWCRVTGN